MKKVSLKDIADEFETITSETRLFYNKETGEFEHCNELDPNDTDVKKYKDDTWVASPTAQDINEYEIMTDFVKQIADTHLQHRLSVALSGKGAFRRFREICLNTGLIEAWYKFKRKEYIAIAKEWCNNAGLTYEV